MASERVVNALEQGTGALANGHTYMMHAVTCAGALAVLECVERDGLLENVGCRELVCVQRWASASGIIRTSATSADAASFSRSSWSRIARAGDPSACAQARGIDSRRGARARARLLSIERDRRRRQR
jgi:hypothetical protein